MFIRLVQWNSYWNYCHFEFCRWIFISFKNSICTCLHQVYFPTSSDAVGYSCKQFHLSRLDQAVPCVPACILKDIFLRLHANSVISFAPSSTLCTCLQLGGYLHTVTCNFSYSFGSGSTLCTRLQLRGYIHTVTCNFSYSFGSGSTLCTRLQLRGYIHTVTCNFSYSFGSGSTLCTCLQLGGYIHTVICNFSYSFGSSSTLCTCLQMGGHLHTVTRKFSYLIWINQYLEYLPAAWKISSHGYMHFSVFSLGLSSTCLDMLKLCLRHSAAVMRSSSYFVLELLVCTVFQSAVWSYV